MCRTLAAVMAAIWILMPATPVWAAEDLELAPNLSFTDDSSDQFPIRGTDLGDASIGGGRAAVVFFGAAHCWNTNREAERLVGLYPKFRDRVRFIIVDVQNPSAAQKPLMKDRYRGFIPTIVIFDPTGRAVYSRSGETSEKRGDMRPLERLLEGAAGR